MAGRFAFNTAIAAIMELTNTISKQREEGDPSPGALRFALATAASLLFPFAPHTAADAYERLTGRRVWEEPWPAADQRFLERDTYELVCQVNGKVRDRVAGADGRRARGARGAVPGDAQRPGPHRRQGRRQGRRRARAARQRRRAVVARRVASRGRSEPRSRERRALARELARLLRRFVAERVSAVTRPTPSLGACPPSAAHSSSPTPSRRSSWSCSACASCRARRAARRPPRAARRRAGPARGGAPRAAAGRAPRSSTSPGRCAARASTGCATASASRTPCGARAARARGADLNAINLAAKVADGQQVVVPRRGAAGAAAGAARRRRRRRRPARGAGQPQHRDGRAARHARRRRPGDGAARSSSAAASTAAFARSTTSARSRASARSASPRCASKVQL